MRFDVYSYSNQGGREYNEDSCSYQINGNSGIFVVADGLGGHQFGELASATVCSTLVDTWTGSFDNAPVEWLNNRIFNSNQAVLELQKEKNATLKSTVVALAIDSGRAVWANSGDSRLYFIRDNQLAGITNDHSVAFKKFKAGEITREQLRTDEDQSCLLRSIGGVDRFEPEIYDVGVMVKPNDAFMLCSDGVWEYLSDEEVAINFLKAEDAKQWAEELLLRVIDRVDGKNDNLTIMTVVVQN